MNLGDSMKKKILYSAIIVVIILLLIVFIPLFSYKMSPNILTVKEINTDSGNMTLSIICNNEKGYYKKLKAVTKNDEVYVYTYGTGFKFLSNSEEVHKITFNINDINKVYIKGNGEEILIYEFKGV